MEQWLRNRRAKRKLHTPLLQAIVVLVLLAGSFFAVPQSSWADPKLKEIAMVKQPWKMAVNPVTNKIYIVNANDDSVTIIDGASNETTEVAVGKLPYAIAVNPITNKIYVTNSNSNNVTVIDGASNETTTVAVGEDPVAVAVNPVTNKIYVVNQGNSNFNQGGSVKNGTFKRDNGSVTVVDGASNKTTTVAVEGNPFAVAVNPVTNKIYVINGDDIVNDIDGDYLEGVGHVTVIDGTSNKTKTIAAGRAPFAVAVNPVTNKIYVANFLSNNVTVIDGASNKTTTVKAGSEPKAVAVNPVTNKIYVVNNYGDNMTVIDGASNKTTTVKVGHRPFAVAANPVTNKIYSRNASNLTVIDGASNKTTTVMSGSMNDVAANPVTNKIFISQPSKKAVTIMDDAGRKANPLRVAVKPMSGSKGKGQTFSFHVANSYSSAGPLVQGVYYQIDSTEGAWKSASRAGKDWTATVASLTSGEHTIYVWALEAQENGVPAGVITAHPFRFGE